SPKTKPNPRLFVRIVHSSCLGGPVPPGAHVDSSFSKAWTSAEMYERNGWFPALKTREGIFVALRRAALEVQARVARRAQTPYSSRVDSSYPSGRFTAPALVRRSNSAEVFRAYDTEQGELVAFKRAVDSESSLRVAREGELLSELSHRKLPALVARGV